MNKLRILYLGLAVLFSGLFVSCQPPAEPGPTSWAGVVRVNMDGSFSDMSGVVLVPTTPSFLSASMAYIYCQIGRTNTTSNTVSITLLNEPEKIDGEATVAEAPGAAHDVSSNAALYDLRVMGTGGAGYSPALFDARTLVVPIAFFVKNETDPAALRTEVALHRFPLVCYVSSIASGDTELKLYVRHVVAGDVSTPRTTGLWLFRAYPLADALQLFKEKSGNEKPLRLVLYYEENLLSDQLSGSNTIQKMVEIPYTF